MAERVPLGVATPYSTTKLRIQFIVKINSCDTRWNSCPDGVARVGTNLELIALETVHNQVDKTTQLKGRSI